jgi:hypothetical protein
VPGIVGCITGVPVVVEGEDEGVDVGAEIGVFCLAKVGVGVETA